MDPGYVAPRAPGAFRAQCCHIAIDPEAEPAADAQVEEESSGLLPWEKLPNEIRVGNRGHRGAQRRATPDEQLEQRRVYAQYAQWAERCGLEEADLRAQLDRAPAKQHERGVLDIPQIPRVRKCAKRRHAVLALRAAAYERAAAAAGRELGDLERAASAQLLELMGGGLCAHAV